MGELFGSMYCWFEDFFGIELANYLWGQLSPLQTTNMFVTIGLWMLGISAAIVLIYYYVINHPRLNNWWGWGIFLLINMVTNLILGWQFLQMDYNAGKMVKEDPATGEMVDLLISEANIWSFATTNMIFAFIWFVLISYTVKWGSTNCSRAPF